MYKLCVIVFVLLLAACGAETEPAASTDVPNQQPATSEPAPASGDQGELLIEPAEVETMTVQVLESFPVQVQVQVQGYLGDGCTELGEIAQQRSGNTIEVTILTQRPVDAMCTMELKGFDEVITLEGPFDAGSYMVIVNGVEGTFQV